MKYKPDIGDALERWARFWRGETLDRPLLRLFAPNGKQARCPAAPNPEEHFFGIDHNLARIEATLASTWWGAETIPHVFFNACWTATAYMSTPEFHDRTIWFNPVEFDFESPPPFAWDAENRWFRRYDEFHAAMLRRAGRDEFMIGQAGVLPPCDMLSMLMETERFLLSLIEHENWMREALRQLAQNWRMVERHFFSINKAANDFWFGTPWNSFWGPKPFIAYQSDVSCMISPDMFREFILPELDGAAEEFGPVWYHLDGPGALCHLDTLLSRDYVRVIQWVPGEGAAAHGPAWIEVYRKVQQAGRMLDLYIPNARDAEYVVRNTNPALLSLRVPLASVREGEQFIEDTKRWSCARGQRSANPAGRNSNG